MNKMLVCKIDVLKLLNRKTLRKTLKIVEKVIDNSLKIVLL